MTNDNKAAVLPNSRAAEPTAKFAKFLTDLK
jgi:hypothetical protein